MNQTAYSDVMYRLKPFLFTHSTIIDMFHFLTECASSIGQSPQSVYISDRRSGQSNQLTYNLATQKSQFLEYLNQHFTTIWTIHLHCNLLVKNGLKLAYTIMFDKHENCYGNNAVVEMRLRDVHLSGLHLDFYLERLQDEITRGYQPDTTDDFVIPSCDIYDLIKEWMNVLRAEECWGGDSTEWFEPQYGGYHYKFNAFRFRRNGPQYIDISLEDRYPHTRSEADEKVRQELLKRGYDEEKTRSHIELWPYGRIVDATWDEYYQMFKQGIKPSMRYADEAELYDNPDALFDDINARAAAHKQLQEKLRSGELNFDKGFMTLD